MHPQLDLTGTTMVCTAAGGALGAVLDHRRSRRRKQDQGGRAQKCEDTAAHTLELSQESHPDVSLAPNGVFLLNGLGGKNEITLIRTLL
jgi:hypothetical protein